jgi:hypothetical protein
MTKTVRKLVSIPYLFVLMNWAAVAGLYYFIQGSAGIWTSVSARTHDSAEVWNSAGARH